VQLTLSCCVTIDPYVFLEPMGVRRKFSSWGQRWHFAYSFQVFNDATQMEVHKTLHPFYPTKKVPNVTATVAYSVFPLRKFTSSKSWQ